MVASKGTFIERKIASTSLLEKKQNFHSAHPLCCSLSKPFHAFCWKRNVVFIQTILLLFLEQTISCIHGRVLVSCTSHTNSPLNCKSVVRRCCPSLALTQPSNFFPSWLSCQCQSIFTSLLEMQQAAHGAMDFATCVALASLFEPAVSVSLPNNCHGVKWKEQNKEPHHNNNHCILEKESRLVSINGVFMPFPHALDPEKKCGFHSPSQLSSFMTKIIGEKMRTNNKETRTLQRRTFPS